jgi:hypothetical protein
MIIASITIANPAITASPSLSCPIARRTSVPSPPAPTIAAIVDIAKAIMTVWFIPAIMVGIAIGIWIFKSSCRLFDPNDLPASTTDSSTCRIPKLVSLMQGGIAYKTVANIAATFPNPNNIIPGTRYWSHYCVSYLILRT